MAFTKVTGPGIHTQANILSHNINSSGIITATEFSGQFSGPLVGNAHNTSGISTFYNLRVSNDLTVEGATTTLDTNLVGVDRVEVGANSNTVVGVAITQSGTADIINLFDGTTEVLTVTDGGKVGIGTVSPDRIVHVFEPTGNNLLFLESGDTNVDIIQADTGGSTRIRNSQGSLVFYVNGDASSNSAANAVTGLTIDGDKDVHVYDDLFIPDKIIHEGDTNTTIRFPADDTITAETGGSERLRITSAGLVGIGDNSPDRMLHVNSASSNECALFESTDTEVTLEFKDTTGTASLKCRNDFRLNNSTGELLRIDPAGRMGLGVSPTASHSNVTASIFLKDGNTLLSRTGGQFLGLFQNIKYTAADAVRYISNGYASAYHQDTGVHKFFTAASGTGNTSATLLERLRIDSSGNVYVKSSSGNQQPKLRIESYGEYGEIKADGNGSIIIDADPDFNSNNSYIGFSVDGSVKSTIDSNGTLNIGATTPTFTSPTPSLNIEKASTGSGPVISLYNGQSANAASTCEILVRQNYRGANKIIFGRENANNWQSSASSAASYMAFHTNSAGTLAERLRIDSNGNIGVNCDSPTNISGHKGITLQGTNSNAGFINFMDSADNSDARILASDGELHIHADASDNTAGSEIVFFVDTSRKACITDAGLLLLNTSDIAFSTGYTQMTIGNTSTQNTGLTIASSASNGFSRLHFADGNSGAARYAGWIAYDHANDEMKFSTANSGGYKVSIDSSGRLSLGSLDASAYYATYNQFVMGKTNDSAGMTIVSGSSHAGYITFADGTSSTDAYRGRMFYLHSDNSFNFRCNGLNNDVLKINSSQVYVTGTGDGVLNLDTSHSSGAFIRFKQGGTTKNWIGCATGLGGYGDNDDLTLLATDNIIFATNSAQRMRLTGSGQLLVGTTSSSDQFHLLKSHNGHTRAVIQNNWGSNATAQLKLIAPTDEFQIVKYAAGSAALNLSNLSTVYTSIGGYTRHQIRGDDAGQTTHIVNTPANGGVQSQYITQVLGKSGNYTNFRVTVTQSSWGSFFLKMYVSGYSGDTAHRWVTGYCNNGLAGTRTVLSNDSGDFGSGSITHISGQQWRYDISVNSGNVTHPVLGIELMFGGNGNLRGSGAVVLAIT